MELPWYICMITNGGCGEWTQHPKLGDCCPFCTRPTLEPEED